MRAWGSNKKLVIRNPYSTRPWQHVLEPLCGYLTLAYKINTTSEINNEPFNFGPLSEQNVNVEVLIKELARFWDGVKWTVDISSVMSAKEAKLLKLNCEKAYSLLSWKPILNLEEMLQMTANWYKEYYNNHSKDMTELTEKQINSYMNLYLERSL